MKALADYAQLGFDGISVDEEIAIAEYIDENKEVCPVELYRGMMVDRDFEIEVGQEIEFENTFASFDEDIDTAVKFATRRNHGVVLVLDEDIEGLPVYMHASTCAGETEWLIPAQKFVITEVWEEDSVMFARIKPS
jgi:hypothetical protein